MIPSINPLEQICLSEKIQWEVFFFFITLPKLDAVNLSLL